MYPFWGSTTQPSQSVHGWSLSVLKPAGTLGHCRFHGVPVAVKVTGLPASPVDVAVNEFAPVSAPSVQPPIAAIPSPLVVTGLVPVRLPSPEATANTTPTPGTGLSNRSLAITAGRPAPAVPPRPARAPAPAPARLGAGAAETAESALPALMRDGEGAPKAQAAPVLVWGLAA